MKVVYWEYGDEPPVCPECGDSLVFEESSTAGGMAMNMGGFIVGGGSGGVVEL